MRELFLSLKFMASTIWTQFIFYISGRRKVCPTGVWETCLKVTLIKQASLYLDMLGLHNWLLNTFTFIYIYFSVKLGPNMEATLSCKFNLNDFVHFILKKTQWILSSWYIDSRIHTLHGSVILHPFALMNTPQDYRKSTYSLIFMSSAQSRSNCLVNSCVVLADEPTVGQHLKPPRLLICCGIFSHFIPFQISFQSVRGFCIHCNGCGQITKGSRCQYSRNKIICVS